MFKLITYNLKTDQGIIKMSSIHLSCEADIKLNKLWTDKRVTSISNSGPIKTLVEANELLNRWRISNEK